MSSKLVATRHKSAQLVEAAVHTHGAAAARILAEKLRPGRGAGVSRIEGPGPGDQEAWKPGDLESSPAGILEEHVATLLQELSEDLGGARRRLVAADEAHLQETGEDFDPRERRDAAAREVSRCVSDLRGGIERIYGTGMAAKLLLLEGRTSQDPTALYRQALRVIRRCSDPEVSWPEGRYGSFQFLPEIAADELRPKVEVLGQALEDVLAERRRAETTQREKHAALERFDATYRSVARIAEGIFLYADMKDLAAKVKPSRRRPASSGKPAAEPPGTSFVETTSDGQGPPVEHSSSSVLEGSTDAQRRLSGVPEVA